MDGENKDLLDLEIERVVEELKTMYPGQQGYTEATEQLDKLYRLKIEKQKADSEILTRAQEEAREQKKQNDINWDRWINLGLGLLGLLVPAITYSYWMGNSLTFETTNSYTSKSDQVVSKHFGFKK